jgi:hypothetical protein
MSLLPATKALLKYLHDNPDVRSQIAARRDATLVYAGNFFRPMWQEISQLKLRYPQMASKQTLVELLARIPTPGQGHENLLSWAQSLDSLQPWQQNGFIAWRALSGIFAANAVGAVSFCIGSRVRPEEKVFAATEIPVLLRNPNVDVLTKDVLAYYLRCMQTHQADMNMGLIRS